MLSSILTVTISVVIEAIPFLVLGTLIATAVGQLRLFDKVLQKMPRSRVLRRCVAALLGIFMPVCECGNVPLSRSLMQKNFSSAEAATFLLAAPILNPITFITTKEAFRAMPWMLPARMLGGLVVALLVGELIGRSKHVLTKKFAAQCNAGISHSHARSSEKGSFSIPFAEEFWSMLKLLLIGAVMAAVFQAVFSQQLFAGIAGNYVTGVLIMILLGFVISICSNVDAFFALAYAGSFRYGALLAFLIAGPMVDIKTLSMLRTTYHWRALLRLSIGVIVLSALIGIGASYVG